MRLRRGPFTDAVRLLADHDLTAGVGRHDPGEDLDRRGLAGAVAPEQRVDLTRTDAKVDPVIGDHGRIGLADPSQLEAVFGMWRYRMWHDDNLGYMISIITYATLMPVRIDMRARRRAKALQACIH